MSVFLFAYGSIQLIESVMVNRQLRKIQMKTLQEDSMVYSLSRDTEQNIKTALDIGHQLLFTFKMSHWQDIPAFSSFHLFSSDSTLANRTEGKGRLATRHLTRHPDFPFPSPANDGDLGLVGCLQYLPPVRLIEEKLFVRFEASNHSSDDQKLFSVIRDGSSNIMY